MAVADRHDFAPLTTAGGANSSAPFFAPAKIPSQPRGARGASKDARQGDDYTGAAFACEPDGWEPARRNTRKRSNSASRARVKRRSRGGRPAI
jgi:hypothetical protein